MKTPKIKVAHFIRTFLFPTETFIYNQIKYIYEENQYEPVVICKNFRNELQLENIEIIKINDLLTARQKKIDNYYYKCFRKLTNNAKEQIVHFINVNKIKLLHFHFLVDARYYLDVIKEAQLPIVVSGYGWDITNLPSKYYGLGKLYLKKIFPHVDKFLAMSSDMKNDMINLGIPANKIIVHYHGINTKRFSNSNRNYNIKEKITILFCGRLTAKKGPLILLKAINKVIKDFKKTNIELIIIGDGSLKSEVQLYINQNKLEDYIEILGHIPHFSDKLLEAYNNADIFILPSMIVRKKKKNQNDKEGIPGTLIEAMSSGLPVISTYHAGIPEIIKNNENGLLVQENNYIELADKILLLANNNNLRKKLGENAVKTSRELDVKMKTNNLIEIYDNLISLK